ncbi:hypothetical protein ABPG74_006641 [Tetrahymena malaccensis]
MRQLQNNKGNIFELNIRKTLGDEQIYAKIKFLQLITPLYSPYQAAQESNQIHQESNSFDYYLYGDSQKACELLIQQSQYKSQRILEGENYMTGDITQQNKIIYNSVDHQESNSFDYYLYGNWQKVCQLLVQQSQYKSQRILEGENYMTGDITQQNKIIYNSVDVFIPNKKHNQAKEKQVPIMVGKQYHQNFINPKECEECDKISQIKTATFLIQQNSYQNALNIHKIVEQRQPKEITQNELLLLISPINNEFMDNKKSQARKISSNPEYYFFFLLKSQFLLIYNNKRNRGHQESNSFDYYLYGDSQKVCQLLIQQSQYKSQRILEGENYITGDITQQNKIIYNSVDMVTTLVLNKLLQKSLNKKTNYKKLNANITIGKISQNNYSNQLINISSTLQIDIFTF